MVKSKEKVLNREGQELCCELVQPIYGGRKPHKRRVSHYMSSDIKITVIAIFLCSSHDRRTDGATNGQIQEHFKSFGNLSTRQDLLKPDLRYMVQNDFITEIRCPPRTLVYKIKQEGERLVDDYHKSKAVFLEATERN